jgi:hypothetical protein
MAFSSRYCPEKLGTAVSGTLYAGTFAIGGVKSDRTTKDVLELPQMGGFAQMRLTRNWAGTA